MQKKPSKRARIVTGCAVAGAVAVGGLGAASALAGSSDSAAADGSALPAAAVQPASLTQSTHLTLDAATQAAQAALDAAQDEGQRVSVAVVDRDGNTLVTLRGDGAGPQAYEAAQKKAFTAVAWNAPTSDLVERLEDAPTLKDIPGTLFLGGGAPITAEGAPIAGIGVAGAPSGALDEEFAQAGVAALAE